MKKGKVIKSTGSWYTVLDENGNSFNCTIRGKFRIDGIKATNPVTVGDEVEIQELKGETNHVIVKIFERRNYIIRKSSNLSKQYHLIASNIDQALLFVTIGFPETTTMFIDRFLLTAEAYRIPVILVFNKVDLYNEQLMQEIDYLIAVYEKIGYKCIKTSATKKTGIEELKEILTNKSTVFSGHSGVGKSSVLNTVDPSLNLKTSQISLSHLKGKHTTTFAEMFPLSFGGFITDTPGIKGFGLIEINREEIFHFFPEIFRISENCKFNNCLHINEPECAVRKAVESGEISDFRYYNYLSLATNEDDKYRLKR
ncbi:MAG: ribosome small subunit-dependent GTPase A [Bacteroidales bacterium]|nr:ribosome small subunit-dependent GTPase A [Bacteroidales bacterium]